MLLTIPSRFPLISDSGLSCPSEVNFSDSIEFIKSGCFFIADNGGEKMNKLSQSSMRLPLM